MNSVLKIASGFGACLGIIIVLIFLIIFLIFILLSHQVPQIPESLDRLIISPPTVIYDAEGKMLYTLGGRDYVSFDKISPYFLKAIISVEDKNFFRHHGIDKSALLRSFILNPIRGQSPGAGASTITQQLTKNLFFTFRKDLSRKFKEILTAMQIESSFSKEEILQAYCNQISFGPNAYGIERAARSFFNKPAQDLTLAQSALLAGLPNSPSRLNPYLHPERALERQRHILHLMKKNALITGEELARAEAETLRYNQNQSSRLGSWFTDRVLEECEKRFGQDAVYFGGLKIFTTLDPVMQNAAQNASSIGIASLRKNTGLEDMEAALIAISPLSGAIVAHIGGTDYSRSQFDRAFDARRRPGSGFKPFLYYTALTQKNYTPATLALDSPITIKVPGSKDWAPENDNSLYYGQVILKFALAKSLNSVAARLVNAIGAEKVIEVARQFGVQSPLDNAPSIALGTSAVSPLEMASAFSIIAASGQYYQPYLIERIESPTGELLYEHFIASKNVADPGTIFLLLDMMKAVIDMGTARSVRSSGLTLPAAGKTGTTDDFTDSWFTGFTPNLCVSVWVGCDQEKPMKDRNGVGITGARGGLPIWIQFMKSALEGTSPRDFSQPPDINYIALNPFTGMPQEGDSSMVVALPASASLPDSPPELSGKYGFP